MVRYKRLGEIFVVLSLFAAIFAVYWIAGGDYQRRTREYKLTVLNVDAHAVMRILSEKDFVAKYHRTTAHPLYALFFKPAGSKLRFEVGRPNAARILNTIVASVGIVLFYWFLRVAGMSMFRSILGAALLAGSASHVLYGAIPETYAFASASLILLAVIYFLAQKDRSFFVAMVPASLFSLGITITNFVFAAILFFTRFFRRISTSKQIVYFAAFCAVVVGLFVALLMVQEQIYPNTRKFFTKHLYESNMPFVSFVILETPVQRLINRTPHLFLYNMIAPGIVMHRPALPGFSEISVLTLVSLIAYILFLIFSVYLIVRFRLYRFRIFLAMLGYFLFSWLFYLIYGDEPHLYTSHYTFAWVAMLLWPFAAPGGIPPKWMSWFTACCILLIPLAFANNLLFLYNLLRLP